jgi:hypothetical protein
MRGILRQDLVADAGRVVELALLDQAGGARHRSLGLRGRGRRRGGKGLGQGISARL